MDPGMLQSLGSQTVIHNLVTEQQKQQIQWISKGETQIEIYQLKLYFLYIQTIYWYSVLEAHVKIAMNINNYHTLEF